MSAERATRFGIRLIQKFRSHEVIRSSNTMMKLVILGSGSAIPDPERGNPSQAVIIVDEVLLFDCGERTSVNLVRAGINPVHVNKLFFTHLHWDHIVDYGNFVISTWNCGRIDELQVFGPSGTKDMSDHMIFDAHKADVDFVAKYVKNLPEHIKWKPVPKVPLKVNEIGVGVVLETEEYRITAGKVDHFEDFGMPSLAYRIDSKHGSVAISGDTRPCQSMIELAKGVDVLVHDCAFLDEIIEERKTTRHSGPTGAGRVAKAAGVKKLVLTHLGPYTSEEKTIEMASMYYGKRRGPEIWSEIIYKAKSEFNGPVVLAHDSMIIEV
jgi:ribonuclease Z